MTENDSLREEVKLEIQSLLSTEKEAIPSKKLFGQYCTEMGKPIPYAKLGYRNMDDFLRSISDVVYSYYNHVEDMLYVKAVPLEGSLHMNKLIQQTPAAKKKKKSTMHNRQPLMSKFKTFRVSSQVAPNRDFNRNYSLNKPAERFSNGRNRNIIMQSPYSINRNYIPYKPPFVNQNQQAGPSMFSSNENIKNNIMFTKQNMIECKPFTAPLVSNSNIPGKGIPGRAHLTPQLMQPRTPVPQVQSATASYFLEPKPVTAHLNTNIPRANKSQGLPGREHLTPQLMQPRTPAPKVVPVQTSVVLPSAAVIENPSADVNTVQNSLMELKISSTKSVDRVNHPEQDNKAQFQSLPKKLSPIKILDVDAPNVFQGKPSTSQAFFTSGYMQRLTASRHGLIKPEDERPIKLEVAVDRVPEMMKKEDHSSRAPLQTPRHLPDGLPSKSDSPVSPLLNRRLPFQPAKSVANLPTANVKPTVPSKRSEEFFCERLKTLVNEFNLGRVHLSHNQMKSGRFVASIKVGQEIFLTYPEDFDCLTDAYEYASKLAVDFLEAKLPTWMRQA